jgi:AcrR family transcriptional regulator
LQGPGVTERAERLVQTGASDGAELKILQRRRPGDSQRKQKELTRKKLLEAAQVVFRHHAYADTAVEMVADQAGVSRTTFYRHFDGKLSLALALFADIAPHLKNEWQRLFKIQTPTVSVLRAWLRQLIKKSSMNQVLVSVFVQIEATEPDAQLNKYNYYDEVWKLSGFDDQIEPSYQSEMDAKFLLMMLQIDQFLYLLCSRPSPVSEDDLLTAMADIIRNFLMDVRSKSKGAKQDHLNSLANANRSA